MLPLEAYLDGVVPAESPPSWMGSGGEAALQALAVAARSVAVALVATEGAICDTTQCQVYEGVPNEYGMTAESAVTSTSGQVLYCGSSSTCGPAGSIAVAEYSSSTGGYTAGGPFPPVPDLGDSVASNPVHAWTVRVPLEPGPVDLSLDRRTSACHRNEAERSRTDRGAGRRARAHWQAGFGEPDW